MVNRPTHTQSIDMFVYLVITQVLWAAQVSELTVRAIIDVITSLLPW